MATASENKSIEGGAKGLRDLARRRSSRVATGLVLVESAVVLDVALSAGCSVERVVVEPDRLSANDEWVTQRAVDTGATLVEVAEGRLAGLVDAKSPQPVAAAVRLPEIDSAGTLASATMVVVLVDVSDPGNVGTLVRAAKAAGADAVAFAGQGADPWSPKVVRSSAGAVFTLPVVALGGDWQSELADFGLRSLGTDVAAGVSYDECDLTARVALVLGNEAHGLSEETLDSLDERIHIPMAGDFESLNVAMAGSVVLFEAARQRRQGSST